MKLPARLLLIAAIGLAAVVLAKNAIAQVAVTRVVKAATGLKLSLGGLSVGLFQPRLLVKDLELFNPPGFTDRRMLDLPELTLTYDLPALLGGRLHVPSARLHVREFVVVKNAQGQVNLDALRGVQEKKAGRPRPQRPPPELAIDLLDLTIGRVVYKDYSGVGPPLVQTFPINLKRRYRQITSAQALANLIVVEAMTRTTIARVTGFDVKLLMGDVHGILQGATSFGTNATKRATDTLKKLLPLGPQEPESPVVE